MVRFFRILLCLLLTATVLTAAGCSQRKSSEGGETSASQETTQAASAAVPAAGDPALTDAASADSAVPDDSGISYNEMEIKKNLNNIETTFDKLIDSNRFKGSVYVKVGNNFDYIKAKGFANQGAHIDNSIYRNNYAGSLTKMFTAAAVMKLKEEGKLSLDDTLDKYFSGCDYGKEVTVRQLLNMTAGIPNYVSRGAGVTGGVTPAAALRDKLDGGENAYDNNKATILSWILSQPLRELEPGEFYYSDSNYYLLGEIIGTAAKMPYEAYLTEQIFKPAGMNKTGFEEDDSTARPYNSSADTFPMLSGGVGYASFGVITNVSDLLKFVDELTAGRIIGKDSMKEMLTDCGEGYGYGVYVNGNCVSCLGELDAYSAKLVFTTDKCRIFAAMSNYSASDPNLIHRLFFNSLRKYRNK